MKKILLSVTLFLAALFSLKSQSLFGPTYVGGEKGGGAIVKFNPATNALSVQQSFQRPGANPYYTSLTLATDGKFYGMTFNGGANDAGIIFSFDPATADYSILYDFDGSNGARPSGSLIQAKDGKLYGMTTFGGWTGDGVIFSFDPSSLTYTKLFDFDNDNGARPSGSLLQTDDGKMYGMTAEGGVEGLGVIFSFDPVSLNVTKLNDFDMVNGAIPLASLIAGGDGLLYGMCANGGGAQAGVIFAFNPNKLTFAKLKDFDFGSGAYPYGNLLKGADGKFYGMTYKGGDNNSGVLFSFDNTSNTYTKLNDFDGTNGADPFGSLVQTADGKIYGMTSDGGSLNAGVIFSYDPNSSGYNKIKDFTCTDGKSPYSNMVMANDGKFYGTTFEGGVNNSGVIFSFDPSSDAYTKLKDFGTNVKGQGPSGSLLRASDGKLYGMTSAGGSYNLGVIYSFNLSTSIYTKVMDFDSINGSHPYGSFIQATDGKLYAMTNEGGNNNGGVIFSFDPFTSAYTKLNDLTKGDGDNPYGGFVEAMDGKLYGLTSNGGKYGYGSIISYDPSLSVFTKLKDFDYKNGGNPYGNLVQADDGKLYGITAGGGEGFIRRNEDTTGAGVIFSIDPSNFSYKKLKDFDYYHDGGFCYGSFIKARNGKLYAMTNTGGINEAGVIFSFDPQTNSFGKLYDFDAANGGNPFGDLLQAADGKLYGAAYRGGDNDVGVIFSLDLYSSLYTRLIDFNNTNGAHPYIGSSFIEVPEGGPLPITLLNFNGRNDGNTNQLSWKIDNEQNLDYYQLQRSTNGRQFRDVFKTSATGNMNYAYSDYLLSTLSPVYYYRLKMVDNDGSYTYSDILKLSINLKGNSIKANPNPFKEMDSRNSGINDAGQGHVYINRRHRKTNIERSKAIIFGD